MSLRQLLQRARRCSSQPPPKLSGLLFLCRALSILPSKASAAPSRRSPAQIQLPQSLPCSNANPLGAGFRIDVVDSDLWPASFGFSSDPAPVDECPDGFQEHEDEEVHDSDDEIDDMRHRKKLFYKLDRGSREFEENNVPLRRTRKRDKANAKNPTECKKVEHEKLASLKVPKLKAKCRVRDDMVEAKRERVPTFNQTTDPYHHPFCLDIHVTKGSVRACFVHRVTSRVVVVAHSISKDMKFDVGSRKGMKACAAVGEVLAKRAIEDDIHNAVYTPRKGDRIEGKIEVVFRAIIENGVDVKVKLKQSKPTKHGAFVAEELGFDMVDAVIKALDNAGYSNQTAQKVMIQSTNSSVLVKFKQQTKYDLVYMISEDVRDAAPSSLADIKKFVGAVSVDASSVFPENHHFTTYQTDLVQSLQTAQINAVLVSVYCIHRYAM